MEKMNRHRSRKGAFEETQELERSEGKNVKVDHDSSRKTRKIGKVYHSKNISTTVII